MYSKGATIIVRSGEGEPDATLILTFRGDGPDWSLEQVELWRSGAGRFRQLVGSPAIVGGTGGDPGVDAAIPLRTLNGDVEGGRIVFRGLRATVMAIGVEPPVPPFPGKARVPDERPADPLGPHGLLTCSGLLQAETPLEAEALAAKLGWGIAWRIRWSGDGGAVFERDEVQPQEGTIIDATIMEATGEAPNAVLLVVAAPGDPLAVPMPVPNDCPVPGEPMPVDPVPEAKPTP